MSGGAIESRRLQAWDVSFGSWPYPRLIAHRGAGLLAPENTLAALRVGASFGYRMFEIDVKLSADGKPVLLHDATLERTTDAQGPVGELSLAQIAQLDAGSWHSAAFAGEPVPLFSNVSAWMRANDLMANVEIKPVPGRETETGAAVALAAAHAWLGRAVPPLLSSFSEDALAAALRAVPRLPRALLLHRVPDDWLERLERLECVALDVNHEALTAETVARAHGEGYRVLAYTVNDPARVTLLQEWGVDAVITDMVDVVPPE